MRQQKGAAFHMAREKWVILFLFLPLQKALAQLEDPILLQSALFKFLLLF